MHRIYLAFLCFFRILFGRQLPTEVLPPAPEPPKKLPAPAREPAKTSPATPASKKAAAADVSPGALQLLALLQREGRLVDFLTEEITGYDDADIGAAVRDIHKGCKKVLAEHFGVEPVLDAEENEAVTVDSGFDPARIRLVGNVSGAPPFKGTLKHHGWRAAKVSLPALSDGMDPTIVAPAEVEL
jgi:uncharacterized protein DUF2760